MNRLTFAQRFLIGSLAILLVGMAGIGFWVASQIQDGVVQRTAATNALFVDSMVASPLQDLAEQPTLSPESVGRLDWLLTGTELGRQVVLFRIIDPSGSIVYSSLPHQVGQQISMNGEIAGALQGQVVAGLGDIEGDTDETNLPEGSLLEIYSPVRLRGTEEVIAIAEFYFVANDLRSDILSAQQRSWLVVGAAGLAMYLVLASFVQRVSNTISGQQRELAGQVGQLRDLLNQNEELSDRVRSAAARTTALNERFLRRFSADLHDGPAQDISLALLRLDHVQERVAANGDNGPADHDLQVIQQSLRRALGDVRDTSSGLLLPELADMTLAGTLDHAIRAHRRRTGIGVGLDTDGLPEQAPLAIKIAIYRVVQEALANAYRHAPGSTVRVTAAQTNGTIRLTVEDSGPGFEPTVADLTDEHLGLVGMRERVESLGGEFRIASTVRDGTDVTAILPLELAGSGHD
jgi:signal transduction histidine kinase